jgi:hypothetical protein
VPSLTAYTLKPFQRDNGSLTATEKVGSVKSSGMNFSSRTKVQCNCPDRNTAKDAFELDPSWAASKVLTLMLRRNFDQTA